MHNVRGWPMPCPTDVLDLLQSIYSTETPYTVEHKSSVLRSGRSLKLVASQRRVENRFKHTPPQSDAKRLELMRRRYKRNAEAERAKSRDRYRRRKEARLKLESQHEAIPEAAQGVLQGSVQVSGAREHCTDVLS